MLILSKEKPAFVPVPLGGDAVFRLRPALSGEVDDAAAAVSNQVAAIIRGSVAAAAIAALVPDFDLDGLEQLANPETEAEGLPHLHLKNKLERLSDRLLLISLCMRCQDGWSGVAADDGPISAPHEGAVALLLQDTQLQQRCSAVIYGRVHREQSEKKA